MVQRGIYSEVDGIFPGIMNPDDEIALQDDRIYGLALSIPSEFVNDVELGAMVGANQTFITSNLTILDDDSMNNNYNPYYHLVTCQGPYLN